MIEQTYVSFEEPFKVAVKVRSIADPGPKEVLVRTLYSAISAGTEMLVYRGQMPADIAVDENIKGYNEAFTYPAEYGYSLVGFVDSIGADVEPEWSGRRVFAFRPHVSCFICDPEDLIVVPDDISSMDAVLIANVETAVSLAMDASPRPGESVAIVGQGIVGLLTAKYFQISSPLTKVVAAEMSAYRRGLSLDLAGVGDCLDPATDDFEAAFKRAATTHTDISGADVTIELSGAEQGLESAVAVTGHAGRLVIGSWYGSKKICIGNLGGAFHRSHMTIVASQVSTLPPALAGRWSKGRRFSLAWEACRRMKPSIFISDTGQVSKAPQIYEHLHKHGGDCSQVIFRYE